MTLWRDMVEINSEWNIIKFTKNYECWRREKMGKWKTIFLVRLINRRKRRKSKKLRVMNLLICLIEFLVEFVIFIQNFISNSESHTGEVTESLDWYSKLYPTHYVIQLRLKLIIYTNIPSQHFIPQNSQRIVRD